MGVRSDGLDPVVWRDVYDDPLPISTEECVVYARAQIINAISDYVSPKYPYLRPAALSWLSGLPNFKMHCEWARWHPDWVRKLFKAVRDLDDNVRQEIWEQTRASLKMLQRPIGKSMLEELPPGNRNSIEAGVLTSDPLYWG